MIFETQEKVHKTNATKETLEAVACLKPILPISLLIEETNKVDFTQKGATENYLCIFQVKWIFNATIKAKLILNLLTHFYGEKLSLQLFLD